MSHLLNRKILLSFCRLLYSNIKRNNSFRTGQNTASLTHTLKLEMLDMVNVKKEYNAAPYANENQRQQYFEGRMIP